MMSLVAVLGVGLLAGAAGRGRLALLALPLAAAGLGVALFHVSLEARGQLECPAGVLGLGSAPQQSLAAFGLLTTLLLLDLLRGPGGPGVRAAAAGGVALGVALAGASLFSHPPQAGPPGPPPPQAPRRAP